MERTQDSEIERRCLARDAYEVFRKSFERLEEMGLVLGSPIRSWDDVSAMDSSPFARVWEQATRDVMEARSPETRLRSHAAAPFGFDVAMMHLRDGGRVRRSGWPEGHYLERHMLPEREGAEIRYVVGSDAGWQGAEVGRLYIVGSTAEGKWIVTMTAICAEDWQTAP